MSLFIKNKFLTISCIIFVTSLAIMVQLPVSGTFNSAYGLTRYFNCITQTANSHGDLTQDDVTRCYDRVFKGAQNNDEFGHPLK